MSTTTELNNKNTEDKITYIETKLLDPDINGEFNSRGMINPIDILDLTNSIRDNGLLQPINVYHYNEEEQHKYKYTYRIILGYRRFTACLSLNFETIPCIIKSWMSEDQARVLNLTENLKRKDLNILQEAKTIEKFKFAGWTQDMVSNALKVSRSWVQNRYAVLSFPPDIQEECAKGTINQIHIKDLYALPLEKQYEEIKRIKNQKARGEKNIQVKKPVAANSKKARTPASMNKMNDFLYETLGPSFGTRCLAWAKGDISTLDLMTDVKTQCAVKGKTFLMPTDDF